MSIDEYNNQLLQYLKESDKPLFVYGNAHTAEVVYKILTNTGIVVGGFIVDSYAYRNSQMLSGAKVFCMDEIPDRDDCNFVIGFNNPEKTKEIIDNSNVFHLFDPAPVFVWDDAFLSAHSDDFKWVMDHLADDKSKCVLNAIIKARSRQDWKELIRLSEGGQYFNDLTIERKNRVYVDCGAFNGDTIIQYIQFSDNQYQKIYAFEPMKENFSILMDRVSSLSNIVAINKAVWNSDVELRFDFDTSASHVGGTGNYIVSATTIDETIKSDKVDFIKMDLEGSEFEALEGARNTIKRCHPMLAVCVYHKPDDVFRLTRQIYEMDENYKFYLRHHSNRLSETVLYAI